MKEALFGKVESRDISNIHIGFVSKINIVKISEEFPENGYVLGTLSKGSEKRERNLVALNLRKIVFDLENNQGTDIFYELNGQPCQYPLCDLTDDSLDIPENNTLVIREFRPASELLEHFGIGPKLETSDDYRKVRSILLTNSKNIIVPKHVITLDEEGIINPAIVKFINEQAIGLRNYVETNLPTSPVKLEKVMGKYLK